MSVKYLIKQNGQIYTVSEDEWVDTGLSEPLTRQDFEEYGIVSLLDITTEKWAELGNEFEVLMWTDSPSNTHKLELTVSEYKPIYLLDSPTLLIWTVSENELQLVTDAIIKQQKRFLVSKDNRQTWWRLSYVEDQIPTWIQVPIEKIYTDGMTKEDLESITKQEWKLWTGTAMTFNLDFAVGMEGVNSEGANPPTLNSLKVTFPSNDAPLIKNPSLVPDNFHNEWVELKATIEDLEGDMIRYRVLINEEKVFPLDKDWFEWNGHVYELFKAYNHSYFKLGYNTVALEVKDDRGLVRRWEGKVVLTNKNPKIQLTYTNFTVTGTIGDDDSDQIAYRILINDKQVYPVEGYTEFFPSPHPFRYEWDRTDLVFDRVNKITVEAIDTFGGIDRVNFNVIGTYKGLMFIEYLEGGAEGNYYTDDFKNILMKMDLGTIRAGQVSLGKPFYVKNMLGRDVVDVTLTKYRGTLPEGTDIELSESDDPFIGKDKIVFDGVMQDQEKRVAYVRVVTDLNSGGIGEFEIKVEADEL